MCSTIGSTKRPPKRLQKQVRETDGRPSCKPGSCGRNGNGGVWGPRRFGGGPRRTHGGTKAESCKSVATPTTQELEEHQATAHAVHRSWCGHCMRARATAARHQTVSHDEESEVPVITLDYFFGEKEGETANLEVKDDLGYHHFYERTRFVLSELSAILHQRDWLSQNHLET